MTAPSPSRTVTARAAEVTPERLALWHDYPWTEAGESLLVNAEWHGPRCASGVTRKYADCDCSLVGAVVSVEVEAVIANRLRAEAAAPASSAGLDGLRAAIEQLADEWNHPDAAEYHDMVPYLVRTEVVARLRALATSTEEPRA